MWPCVATAPALPHAQVVYLNEADAKMVYVRKTPHGNKFGSALSRCFAEWMVTVSSPVKECSTHNYGKEMHFLSFF